VAACRLQAKYQKISKNTVIKLKVKVMGKRNKIEG
jgi:hypothetical protein